MAELFGVGIPAISKHLKNIFEELELDEQVVISKMEITTRHGAMSDKQQKNQTRFYNLDAIISVGSRINSKRATNFRIWATSVLKEYRIKGFVLDDEWSVDYDRESPTTRDFYAMVQNKFHYAITGQTAAEIIFSKTDHNENNMG